MHFFIKLCLFLAITPLLSAQECDHSRERTQNILAPDVKFTFIPRHVTDNSAVAFLAEAGRRNFRFNGTFGLLCDSENRFKVSGEYLQQKLGYNYSTGTARRWVRQFAAGAAFEHDFCNPYITTGEFSAYCSYAPTRYLGSIDCGSGRYFRRIAGSTAYGCELGSTVRLWPCAFLFVDANYDAVIYHRRFYSNKHVKGFGGSIGFHQQFFDNVGFDLRAEFRRPFNYYRASISWAHPQLTGLTIGVFGSHTRGKCQLPSNTMAGIEINYVFSDLFNSSYNDCGCCGSYCAPELACWVTTPAVYLPEVLAIAEERFSCPIATSTTIPPFATCAIGPFFYAVGGFFANPPGASPFVFSATGLPSFATIDPITGVISGVNIGDTNVYNVAVTADNGCSTTTQSFTMRFACPVTSSPIAPIDLPLLAGTPYVLDVVTGNFTSACGQQIIYTAIGLPIGSSINPVTGLISGISPGDGPYTVTITGTTECGVTQQTFVVDFSNA